MSAQADEPPLAIRRAAWADLDALLTIEAVFPSDQLGRRAFRHALRSASIDLLVADQGGSLLGYGMVHRRQGSPVARLTSIAVVPEAAGRGIGRRLLAAMEEAARRHGSTRLRLEVRADNRPAQKLYDRSGYSRFEMVDDYYEDGEAAWRYEKVLM